MLYYPWRNEEEIVNADCESLFSRHREEIMQNRNYHYITNGVLDDATEQAQNDAQARVTEAEMDPFAPTFDFDNYYLDEQEVAHVEDGQYERIQYAENFQLPEISRGSIRNQQMTEG
ncbi:unnamed protein product [Gongylonema pulchrum]|uniref:Integrase catalytic domain-containing protein n=1 Tax=Gongylonema pulchrum TaxID=637853 RepID=A0A183DXH1_9BILA|nr:unnamed protein product [Gongylonema pulchrum]